MLKSPHNQLRRTSWRRRLPKFFHGGEDCSQGVAAIEFAMISPIIILMGVAVFDLGEAIYRDMQVQNAAQVGAQYAFMHGFDAPSITGVVTSATGFAGISASPAPSQFCGCAAATGISNVSCNAKCSDGSAPGTYVKVSAQASYITIIPYPFIPPSFAFAAQSTVRTQ